MLIDYRKKFRRLSTCLLLFSLLLLSSCGVDKESLDARVTKRWNALVNGDFLTAYEFETPAYRKTYSLNQYTSGLGGAVTWSSAEIDKVQKNGNIADVYIKIEAVFDGMLIDSIITERWVLLNDQWWHAQK